MATEVAKMPSESADGLLNKAKDDSDDDLVSFLSSIIFCRARRIDNFEMNCICFCNVSRSPMLTCMKLR